MVEEGSIPPLSLPSPLMLEDVYILMGKRECVGKNDFKRWD